MVENLFFRRLKILALIVKTLIVAMMPRRKIIYPRIVNFPITNQCNFQCVMCNVWRNEFDTKCEMTAKEIGNVFGQRLFSRVVHVGISGGEPLLKKGDLLPSIIAICESLPKLQGLSLITNASLDDTLEILVPIRDELSRRGVRFCVEASLDGIGEIHDSNRGQQGAYKRVVKNVLLLKKSGILNSISTTITKLNCSNLWEIYRFARINEIQIDFRVACQIDRLNNASLAKNYDFTKIEKYRIIKFLENIIFYYENDRPYKQIFYASLIGQLQGELRRSGCAWKSSEGVSLDPYGNLYFCFPRSKKLGNLNTAENHDIKFLKQNSHYLDDATKNCGICCHDYSGSPDLKFLLRFFGQRLLKARLNWLRNTWLLLRPVAAPLLSANSPKIQSVTIVGWYGTETLGDKLILGGILLNLFRDGIVSKNITIMSLHPSYTVLTLLEMGMMDVKVVDLYQAKDDDSYYKTQDLFLFGGGPLCDVEPLVDILEVFRRAKKAGKLTHVYAAGIGPLKENRYIRALNKLLVNSDRVSFRDEHAVLKYKEWLPVLSRRDTGVFIDPATNYIRKVISENSTPIIKSEYVICAFRNWPYMYADGLSYEKYSHKNSLYEAKWHNLISEIQSSGKIVVLFPMHNFCIGDDDREYYLKFLSKQEWENGVVLVDHDYTPEEALNYFKYASLSLSMRFHSVVAAISCNIPCVAIDYHYGRGKITGFMETIGLESMVYDIDSFNATAAGTMLESARKAKPDWNKINTILHEKNEALYRYMSIK